MSIIKKLEILIPTLLVLSCSKVDKYSSIGSAIIGAIDSSAVAFDGTFYTDSIVPTVHMWGSSAKDSLSGLHRYQDSLSRSGYIQTAILIGRFEQEESWGYYSFAYNDDDSMYVKKDNYIPSEAEDIGDSFELSDTISSISKEIYKLLADSKSDSVKTSLVFVIDTNRTAHENYSLELSTAPFFNDSTKIDTVRRHVIQHALIPGHRKSTTIDLPYTFYNSDSGDVITKTINNGVEERSCSLYVQSRHVKFRGDSAIVDTTFELSNTAFTDTVRFTSSEIAPYYYFLNISSDISSIETTPNSEKFPYEYSSHYFKRDTTSVELKHTLVDITIADTVLHSWFEMKGIDTTNPVDSNITLFYDTLSFSKSEKTQTRLVDYNVLDSTFEKGLKEYITYDSIVKIFDTLKVYHNITVTQEAKTFEEIIDIPTTRGSFTLSDGAQLLAEALDTMNIMIKDISEDSTSLLPLSNVIVKLVGYSNNGETKTEVGILPRRSSMTVFNHGVEIPTTVPFMSGGQEQFVRLKINADNFWNTMFKNTYLTISEANIELPLKSVKLPPYVEDGKLSVKYLLSTRKYSTMGDLLSHSLSAVPTSNNDGIGYTEKKSYSVQIVDDSIDVQLGLTEQLTDLHFTYNLPFKDGQAPLDTYLYIWVDGSDMAHILFDSELKYALNYIVQNKMK